MTQGANESIATIGMYRKRIAAACGIFSWSDVAEVLDELETFLSGRALDDRDGLVAETKEWVVLSQRLRKLVHTSKTWANVLAGLLALNLVALFGVAGLALGIVGIVAALSLAASRSAAASFVDSQARIDAIRDRLEAEADSSRQRIADDVPAEDEPLVARPGKASS